MTPDQEPLEEWVGEHPHREVYDPYDEAQSSMRMLTGAIITTLVAAVGLVVWGVGLLHGWW